jgi:hypothetical protein
MTSAHDIRNHVTGLGFMPFWQALNKELESRELEEAGFRDALDLYRDDVTVDVAAQSLDFQADLDAWDRYNQETAS